MSQSAISPLRRVSPVVKPLEARLSDHTFWANQFRLLAAAAYWSLDTVHGWLSRPSLPQLQLATLRLQVLKIGGWVHERLEGIHLHLAHSYPAEPLWHLLATRPTRA